MAFCSMSAIALCFSTLTCIATSQTQCETNDTDTPALLQTTGRNSHANVGVAADDWHSQAQQWVDALNARVRSWNGSNTKFDNSLHSDPPAGAPGQIPKVTISFDFDRTLADAYDCLPSPHPNPGSGFSDLVKAIVDKATPDMTGSAVTSGAAEKGFTYQNDKPVDERHLEGLNSQLWQGCFATLGVVVPQAGEKLLTLKSMGTLEVVSYGPSGWERLNLPAKIYTLFFNDLRDHWDKFEDRIHGKVHDKGDFLKKEHSDLRCHVHFDDAAIHIDQVNKNGGIGVNVDGHQGLADTDILAAMGALYLRGCVDDAKLAEWKGVYDKTSTANIWNAGQNGYSTWVLQQTYDIGPIPDSDKPHASTQSSLLDNSFTMDRVLSKKDTRRRYNAPKYVAYFDSAPEACEEKETDHPPKVVWNFASDDGTTMRSPLDFHRNSDHNNDKCLQTFCNGGPCGPGKISIGAVHNLPFYTPGHMVYWLRSTLSFYRVKDLNTPLDLGNPTYTIENVTIGQESWSGLFSSGDNWWLHSPSCYWEFAQAPNHGWPSIYCWTTTPDVCVSFQVENPKSGVNANVLDFHIYDEHYPYKCPTTAAAIAPEIERKMQYDKWLTKANKEQKTE